MNAIPHLDFLAGQFSLVRSRMKAASAASVLSFSPPTLIAVSKNQPLMKIEAAVSLGHKDFGENRVQEAAQHWGLLKQHHPDLRLHLIGPLQSNKVTEAVALFDVIHAVDRTKIAEALKQACDKQSRSLTFMVQVNTGAEPQKAGILPEDVGAFVADCQHRIGLPIRGLMCIPPAGENPAPHFALLHQLATSLGLPHLSMGMSRDYEVATQLGATYVRVGTELFGERE